jgi:hypothetical protein
MLRPKRVDIRHGDKGMGKAWEQSMGTDPLLDMLPIFLRWMARGDQGAGERYVPSAMPKILKDRYPQP